MINKKDKEYKKCIRSKLPHTHNIWNSCNKLKREVKENIASAKRNHLDNLAAKLDSPQRNDKDWWRASNLVFGKKKELSDINLVDNGVLITDNLTKANLFNAYFASITSVEGENDTLPNLPCYDVNSLSEIRVSVEETINALSQVNKSSAVGPDGVHNLALFHTRMSIGVTLTYLFNQCLSQCIMPKYWKLSHIIPIHKKGPEDLTANYRPISLISCTSKILECLVHNKMMSFFVENNFICPEQFGFLTKSSCCSQLLEVVHKISETLDNRLTAKLIFLDLSKAFDKVWHTALLYKLKCLGIKGKLLAWLQDYLTGRVQRVSLGGILSDIVYILAGIPQGSILGPILFLVYINDIAQIIKCILRLFADDNILMACGRDQVECVLQLQPELDNFIAWAKSWKILVNPSKTQVITFGRTVSDQINVTIGDDPIMEVFSHKHLGVFLQEDLKWNVQIDSMIKSAEERLSVLKFHRFIFSSTTLRTMYIAFIRSLIEYASSVWLNITQRDQDRLENIYLSAMRAITGCKVGTSHNELYREAGLQPLRQRQLSAAKTSMYDVYHEHRFCRLGSSNLTTIRHANPYSIRTSCMLRPIKCRTESHRTSFLPHGIQLVNEILQHK